MSSAVLCGSYLKKIYFPSEHDVVLHLSVSYHNNIILVLLKNVLQVGWCHTEAKNPANKQKDEARKHDCAFVCLPTVWSTE